MATGATQNKFGITGTEQTGKRKSFLALLLFSAIFCAIVKQSEAAPMPVNNNNNNTNNTNTNETTVISTQIYDSAINITNIASSSNATTTHRRRIQKRHSDELYFQLHPHHDTKHLEWQNPCGGVYEELEDDTSANLMRSLYLTKLRDFVKEEKKEVMKLTNIDISAMKPFRIHGNTTYKFLPEMSSKSKIRLRHWYSNMQVYVGSFAHLGHEQYKWERNQQQPHDVSKELHKLLLSAREVLCEIETAINGSYTKSNKDRIRVMTREEMNRKLDFQRREQPYSVDLKYTKYKYKMFLANMRKSLSSNLKMNSDASLHDSSAAADEQVNSEYANSQGSSDSDEQSFEVFNNDEKRRHRQHKRKSVDQQTLIEEVRRFY